MFRVPRPRTQKGGSVSLYWQGLGEGPEPGPLTAEMLMRGIENIKKMPPDPCSQGNHVVSTVEKDQGYGICANCRRFVGEWPA